MTTLTSQDREAAYQRRHCEKCGRILDIDAVHVCKPKSLGELANEFEDKYNAKLGRTGVRWAGD